MKTIQPATKLNIDDEVVIIGSKAEESVEDDRLYHYYKIGTKGRILFRSLPDRKGIPVYAVQSEEDSRPFGNKSFQYVSQTDLKLIKESEMTKERKLELERCGSLRWLKPGRKIYWVTGPGDISIIKLHHVEPCLLNGLVKICRWPTSFELRTLDYADSHYPVAGFAGRDAVGSYIFTNLKDAQTAALEAAAKN